MKTRDWYAWLNRMPPAPVILHVSGEIEVGNPGMAALLTVKTPQGFNPAILLLDLHLWQRPGNWSQVVTWAPARFEKLLGFDSEQSYTDVEVFFEEKSIAQMKVRVAQ